MNKNDKYRKLREFLMNIDNFIEKVFTFNKLRKFNNLHFIILISLYS